jgi:hypothetical protein
MWIKNKVAQVSMEVIVLLVAFCGIFLYMDYSKRTESNQFKDQSQQVNHTAESKPVISLINLNWSSSGDTKSKSVTSPNTVPTTPVAKTVEPIVVEPVMPTLEDTFGVSKQQLANIGHLNWVEKIFASIVIILVVMFLGGLLDAIGGDDIIELRRYAMPALLSIGVGTLNYIFNPVWVSWLICIAIWPMMGTLTLKYMSGDNFGRAEWLFLQAVTGGIFITLISLFFHCHILAWWLFIIYSIIAGIGGGTYKNVNQFKGDFWTGSLCLCSLILYVFLSLQFKL